MFVEQYIYIYIVVYRTYSVHIRTRTVGIIFIRGKGPALYFHRDQLYQRLSLGRAAIKVITYARKIAVYVIQV